LKTDNFDADLHIDLMDTVEPSANTPTTERVLAEPKQVSPAMEQEEPHLAI
jgi:hypothetical protein